MPGGAIRLGDYEIDARLGAGGMGEVWAARHDRFGDVALKILAAPLANVALTEEARAVAHLDHPAIVRLFDAGTLDTPEGPRPFLAMERCDGGPVSRVAGWRWPEILAFLDRVLEGLGHAHARGIVHRDVKPENLLLRSPGDPESVCIVDFGIAYAANARGSAVAAGTPGFMAPEQMHGRTADLGPSTDLYAVGCVARALTGGTAVPADLEAWCAWLTAPSPSHRPRWAAEARASLRALGPATTGDPSGVAAGSAETISVTRLVDTATDEETSEPTTTDEHPGHPAPSVRVDVPPRPRRGDARPTEGLGLVAVRRLPLVGRDAEQDLLWTRLRRAVDGSPQVVVVRGGRHTGKSALLRWIVEEACEAGVVEPLVAAFAPDGSGGEDAMRAWLAPGLPRMLARSRIARRAALDGLAEEDADRLYRWLYAPEKPLSLEARIDVAFRVLRARALRRPLLLGLDDVHWGGPALEIAARLCRAGTPVLVVATIHPDLASAGGVARHVGELVTLVDGATADLAALAPVEHRRLLGTALKLDPELLERTAEATGDDPSLGLEVLRGWVANGQLVPGPAGFRHADGVPAVPRDRREVWRGRIEALRPTAAERGVLRLAATLGTPVRTDALGPGAAALVDRLVLQEVAYRVPDGFAWSEDACRDAIVDEAREAGAWHDVVSRVVREGALDPQRAGRLLLEDGRADEAFAPMMRAVELAMGQGDTMRADALLDLLLPTVDPDDTDRWSRALDARLRTKLLTGQRQEVPALLESLAALARKTGRDLDFARAWVFDCEISRMRGELDRAVESGRLAVAHALRADDMALRAYTQRTLGLTLSITGRFEEAEPHLRRALDDAPDDAGLAFGLLHLGTLLANAGRFAEAREALERGIATATRNGSLGVAMYARLSYGDVLRHTGELLEAEAVYRTAWQHFWLGRDIRAGDARLYLGLTWLRLGRVEAAETTLREACEAFEAAGRRLVAPLARVFLAEAYVRDGRLADARDAYDRAIAAEPALDLDVVASLRVVAERVRSTDAAWAADASARADVMERAIAGA